MQNKYENSIFIRNLYKKKLTSKANKTRKMLKKNGLYVFNIKIKKKHNQKFSKITNKNCFLNNKRWKSLVLNY
jgi:hypothetical protein